MRRLRNRRRAMAAGIAGDIGRPDATDELEGLVERFLDQLARGERVTAAERDRLRAEGATAAREGASIQATIDRYLTAGWVTWDHAAAITKPDERDALTSLGGALLRAGDDAAAALADGYAAAERSLAARDVAMRRAVLDELLTYAPGSGAEVARVRRRAALVGLDPSAAVRLLVARGDSEMEEEDVAANAVIVALQRGPRRGPLLAAVRGGDLVAVLQEPAPSPAVIAGALAALEPGRWWAVVGAPVTIDALAGAYADAIDALRVARVSVPPGEVTAVASMALERAMTADRSLARDAVDHWLGPIASARNGDELLETLEGWFAAGESVTGAARALHLAPRTVSYRLVRIWQLLGRDRLDGETRLRLAAGLLLRRLLTA